MTDDSRRPSDPAPPDPSRSGRSRRVRRAEAAAPAARSCLQLICLFITATVLFPILWILSMAVDPRNLVAARRAQPDPAGRVARRLRRGSSPSRRATDHRFLELALEQLPARDRASAVLGRLGVTAAYAFSRLRFRGREVLMIAVLGVLMLPAVATIVPLFIMLNSFRSTCRSSATFNLRAIAPRRGAGRRLRAAAVRDLEPQGLPRHDPEGARGGGGGRRRDAEPDLPARSSCRWPCRRSR